MVLGIGNEAVYGAVLTDQDCNFIDELISLALFVRVIPHAQKLQTEENGGSLAPYCLERKIK